jgi:predicted PurR-regulated permease PerM
MVALIAVLAAVMFLWFASALMIPIVIALLIACAAAPLVAALDRVHVPRWIGAFLVVFAIAAAAGAGLYGLGDQIAAIGERLPNAVNTLRESLAARGGAFEAANRALDGGITGSVLMRGSSSVASLAGDIVIVFFLVYFLLLAGDRFAMLIASIGTAPHRRVTQAILNDIYAQVRRFLLVQLLTNVIVGAATYVLLLATGVEHAAFWAVMAGIGNTIPYFGPVIITAGLGVVAMMQLGAATGVAVAAGALAITSIEGWLIVPPLMGRTEHMNVLAVFVGLLVWSWIWGVWGTILAVPMLAVIKATADHVESLRPLGMLLGPLPERPRRAAAQV